MERIQHQVQQLTDTQAAATLVATGVGGSVLDALTVLTPWVDHVVKFGNAALILGGVYLMWVKIQNSRRRDRREGDETKE